MARQPYAGAVKTTDLVLREATPDDALAGARMHIACWREAYGPLTDPAVLEPLLADETAWADRWRLHLEAGLVPRTLALVGDEIVGWACVGPGRDDDSPAPEELYALYVREAWHGTGLGARLTRLLLGDRPAYVWVLEDNARARAFYARQGFTPDGRRTRDDRLGLWDIRMARP